MNQPPDPPEPLDPGGAPDRPGAPGAGALSGAEEARLRPLAGALRAAAAAREGPPRLTLVTGDVAGAERVGLLAGTFNPFTTAHAALADAGHRAGCDRVLLTMAPVSLAKENVERAHALDRLDWVTTWARTRPWAAVAVASHPLLVDMVEACASLLAGTAGGARARPRPGSGAGPAPEVALLLGADKAAQIAEPGWYGDPDAAFAKLTRLASIMVAVRAGHPLDLPSLPFPATPLPTPSWAVDRSATEARAAAAEGRALAGLVPIEIAGAVLDSGAYAGDAGPYLTRISALQALVGPA